MRWPKEQVNLVLLNIVLVRSLAVVFKLEQIVEAEVVRMVEKWLQPVALCAELYLKSPQG